MSYDLHSDASRWLKPRNSIHTRGLSLLEVVLSLAILSVAAAYLAQSMFLASENAIRAQRMSQAELVAESVVNQIVAGVLPAQPVNWASYASPNPFGTGAQAMSHRQWVYSISNVGTEVQGMVGIQVSVQEVRENQPIENLPDLTVIRWIIDPSLGLDTPPAPTSTQGATGI